METKTTVNHGLSNLLIIVAIISLILALIGMINAAQLNREMSEMGMGNLSFDEVVSFARDLARYSGSSFSESFGGMDAFVLFTVTNRILFAVLGAGAFIFGLLLRVHGKSTEKGIAGQYKAESDMAESLAA